MSKQNSTSSIYSKLQCSDDEALFFQLKIMGPPLKKHDDSPPELKGLKKTRQIWTGHCWKDLGPPYGWIPSQGPVQIRKRCWHALAPRWTWFSRCFIWSWWWIFRRSRWRVSELWNHPTKKWHVFFCKQMANVHVGVSLNGGTPKTPQNDHF